MADKPIIFSAPMILALLEGRKMQTRRVMKPKWRAGANESFSGWRAERVGPNHWQLVGGMGLGANITTPYAPGDRLWVRETWRPHYLGDGIWDLDISYAADGELRRILDGEFGDKDWNWPKAADRGNVSPLFMPRWASRITLTVTDVSVQRLRDMSDRDAIAEGIDHIETMDEIGWKNYAPNWPNLTFERPLPSFATLWNSIHGPEQFAENPWVAAYTFTVQSGNIDQLEAVA